MKKRSARFMTLVLMCLVITPPIVAAEPTGGMKMDMPGEGQVGQVQKKPNKVSFPEEAPYQASRLIGMDLVNTRNEELGTVKDILIGSDGRVNYLIISRWFMGTGERLTPVPYSALDPDKRNEGKMILDVSPKELEAAPRIASDEVLHFSKYEGQVDAYYGSRLSPSMDKEKQAECR